ncbi:olfactory receptor 1E16-like [Branchiostoma floridae x Branchiostoma japonicum]
MEEETATDDPSETDGIDHVLSIGSTFRDLQTAYLIISLVLSVGCGLLVIFLVWKKEHLRKPSHFLRCNLAVDDIIFTSCLIPVRIYTLFREDVSGQYLMCSGRMLVGAPCLVSTYGTYLMMAVDLYHFVCNPLHYHDKVTTKRVVAGIVTIRALSLFFGLAPVAFGGLRCEDANNVAVIFRRINLFLFSTAALSVPMLYCRIFKEARRQQERDENRNLWVFQTKAFKMMAPQATVWAISVATVIFQVAIRVLISEEQRSHYVLTILDHVSSLLYLTVPSMANPIIYSFRLPDFRRAIKELCGLPTNTPPVVPASRHRDMEMTTITGQRAPAIELAPAQTSGEGPKTTAEDVCVPSDQEKSFPKQTTKAGMNPGLAPSTECSGHKTASQRRPFQITVKAEVHAEPTPCPGQDVAGLPGQLNLDAEPTDAPTRTSTVTAEMDKATVGHTLMASPARPKVAWQ